MISRWERTSHCVPSSNVQLFLGRFPVKRRYVKGQLPLLSVLPLWGESYLLNTCEKCKFEGLAKKLKSPAFETWNRPSEITGTPEGKLSHLLFELCWTVWTQFQWALQSVRGGSVKWMSSVAVCKPALLFLTFRPWCLFPPVAHSSFSGSQWNMWSIGWLSTCDLLTVPRANSARLHRTHQVQQQAQCGVLCEQWQIQE